MRKMMLEGIRPNECEYCWKVEQNLPNAISDRVYKTVIYDDEAIAATVQAPWDADPALKTLEISFERTCNFACSYCNPAFSTSWVRDIKRNGPYVNIISDGRGHFTDTAPWAESPKDDQITHTYKHSGNGGRVTLPTVLKRSVSLGANRLWRLLFGNSSNGSRTIQPVVVTFASRLTLTSALKMKSWTS